MGSHSSKILAGIEWNHLSARTAYCNMTNWRRMFLLLRISKHVFSGSLCYISDLVTSDQRSRLRRWTDDFLLEWLYPRSVSSNGVALRRLTVDGTASLEDSLMQKDEVYLFALFGTPLPLLLGGCSGSTLDPRLYKAPRAMDCLNIHYLS